MPMRRKASKLAVSGRNASTRSQSAPNHNHAYLQTRERIRLNVVGIRHIVDQPACQIL
jgi:hypothetical protein